MLNFSATRITGSIERAVAPGYQITAEGQALVMDLAAGGVRPSNGTAGEVFVGFALATQINPEFKPEIVEATSSAGGVLELGYAPVAGTARLVNAVTGSPVTIDGTTVDIEGTTITGVTASTAFRVTFTRALTVQEAKSIQGDILPGGAAANAIGSVGVVYDGDVYTDQYDTAADWGAATTIKLGADGKFTTSGAGTTLTNVVVVALPGIDSAFLGLHVNA